MLGYHQVIEVDLGGASADDHFLNQCAYMWSKLKDWLLNGAVPPDTQLEVRLTGPGYHINRAGQLVIESKQDMASRGMASPDDADALALTFAHPVEPPRPPTVQRPSILRGLWH